ncbi:Ca(2+)-binding ATP:ADP antiporter SAL1 [Sugiyamaella lignohabitans]|uniref:Ca(2+)-binding ATP:ADP antiporter SAL1 n=1 Tax=Sugiyamaella lignohabitans TaxID=796027 RepID=A0A161HGG6_9ASCO|nr:Ca(2+)-binding ATP:ADP antiporter SAL1 [Sugiyamaella lignohabitans]ANB14840.1 Ca(2+)-binding ATP:ADP antiporter SAL1 [Sugiyamaella lignohabitans]
MTEDENASSKEARIRQLFEELDVEGKNVIDAENLADFMVERYQDFDGLDDAVNQLLEAMIQCGDEKDNNNANADIINRAGTGSSPTGGSSNAINANSNNIESANVSTSGSGTSTITIHPQTTGPDATPSYPYPLEKITYASFKNYVNTTEALLEKSFKNLDSNNDGLLGIEDLKRGFESLNDADFEIDDEKLEVLFNAIDSDDDGYISLDDWKEQLTFIPKFDLHESPLKSAYMFFIEELDLSSEGDVLLNSESSNGIGYFLAGGLAGVVSRTCTAPFDRLKVYLIATSGAPPAAKSAATAATAQAAKETVLKAASSSAGKSLLKGGKNIPISPQGSPLIAALKHLWAQGGIRAFFVGNGLNVVKVFPESAMKFGTFEAAKRLFAQIEGVSDPSELSRLSTFVSGGLGGMAAQLTVYPIDTLKFRVQCSAQFSPLRGNQLLLQTVRNTLSEGGIGIFYRGLHVGVLGIFPFAALDLGIFSAMKKAYINNQATKLNVDPSEVKPANIIVLTMGALSGSLGASAVYPVNLLRTRLQAQGTAAHPYHYKGFRDVLRKTVERDGYRGLFRGLGPNLAKVAPAVSISYLVYEKAKQTMKLA